jgi:glutamine amidotransferase
MLNVSILDLGVNNLNSVKRAFSEHLLETDVIRFSANAEEVSKDCNLIILPGLGSFESGMKALYERNFVDFIRESNDKEVKILGICLGMQLLFRSSEESPNQVGLGLLEGHVSKLPTQTTERVPNVGWNSVDYRGNASKFKSLQGSSDFYFVHSYALLDSDKNFALSTTSFGTAVFVSSIETENILAFQFHPEKSGKIGRKLIAEMIEWARED